MRTPKKAPSKLPEFFAALIRHGYFPVEIPPAVTTRYFADFCRSQYAFLRSQQDSLIAKTTNYETFTAPRGASGRRNLALVHPLTQAGLSLLITQNRTRIRKFISENSITLYRTTENLAEGKAFEGLDFRKWDALKTKLYSEHSVILHADISRFFYTMYTHSIPWAIIGKTKVKGWLATKKRQKLDKHWSNNFDVALQSCRSRETFGIPVGPDTSRLVAELLLAGVERDEELASFLKTHHAIRLVDDYTFGFDDEETARKCLATLRSALWKFNLQLNEEKTTIRPARMLYRPKWELDHGTITLSDSDPASQERDIYRIIDLTLHYCAESKTDAPAIRAAHRLSQLKNIGTNFSIILDALFRLARDFPRSISHASSFLINNQRLCVGPIRDKVVVWVKATLHAHLPHGHDFEVAWCLVVCAVLKIEVGKDEIPNSNSMPNAVVFALLGLMHEKGLLKVRLSSWPWRAHLKKQGINSENWLPYYESVRRNWTKDKKMVATVRNDPVWSKMLSAKVKFLEDSIFEAARINLSRRVFQRSRTQQPANLLPPPSSSRTAKPKTHKPSKKIRGFADIDFEPDEFDY